MKLTTNVLALIYGLLLLANVAHAESARDQLHQMVAQLQKTPADNELRERILKHAQQIKPAPAVPEEARRAFVRGNAAMSNAKAPEDYGRAVQLYEEATKLAPWWADPYYNLAKAREQRQEYGAAIRSLRFYLLADIPAADMREAQDRIYVLEEKASARQREKDRPQALAQRLQSQYGNRRWTTHLSCWITDGRSRLTCNAAEANGTTWTQGARDGSFSWMPLQTRAGSLDFTSLNLRYMFRVDSRRQNQIVMGYSDNEDLFCGSVNGPEIKDIEWQYCQAGQAVQPVTLSFGVAPNGRPMIERAWGCDAVQNCARNRWILE